MKQSEINRLYREKMVSGGYCPKCGDFLIPRKKTTYIRGVGYKGGANFETGVSLECINPQCDYKIDLGDDAQVTERKTEADNPINSISGKLYPKNEIYHRDAFGSKDIIMCSGQIKRSLLPSVKKSSIVDMFPLNQELNPWFKDKRSLVVEYFDEKNELRRAFLEDVRIIDE